VSKTEVKGYPALNAIPIQEFLFYYEKYTPPVDDGQNGYVL
jgi:hypothetical protein